MPKPVEAKFMRIPPAQIDPGPNVRVDETALDGLIESIRQHGILQPITVVPTADGQRVECLFGHRRLAAARRLGLETVPCLGRERGTDAARILMQLAENRDRVDMTLLEEARVLDQLRRAGMTKTAIAKAIGMSDGSVIKRLKLLEYPTPVQQQVHLRQLPLEVAVTIPLELAQETDPAELNSICRRGSAAVRDWITQKVDEAAAQGRTIKAKTHEVVMLDGMLMSRVRAVAKATGTNVTAWVTDAIRERLAGRAQRELENL